MDEFDLICFWDGETWRVEYCFTILQRALWVELAGYAGEVW